MSSIAQETGVILTLWKPDAPNINSLKRTLARGLQLHIEGGYHNLARFLDQTQYLSKTMGVTSLTMRGKRSELGEFTIQATLTFMGYERNVQSMATNFHRFITSEHVELEG